nr:transcriptional regulator, MalT family domain protein [Rhodococcus sp. JVH1]
MTDRDRPAPLHGVSPKIKAELESEGFREVDEIGHGGFGVSIGAGNLRSSGPWRSRC